MIEPFLLNFFYVVFTKNPFGVEKCAYLKLKLSQIIGKKLIQPAVLLIVK